MQEKKYDTFKDYIEKRTVEDIMLDYGEQRDEWSESPKVKTENKNDNKQND